MGMKTMNDLRNMLCEELEEIVRTGSISAGDLESVHILTDTIKNIDKIGRMEEEGCSYDGDWRASGTYSNGRDMSNGYSGRHYVRGHYSNANERAMISERIESMMHNSNISAGDREALRMAIDEMRK